LAGFVVGALVVLMASGPEPATEPIEGAPAEPIDVVGKQAPDAARTLLLAWARDGLPARTESVLEAKRDVVHATTVVAGLEWIKKTVDPDGSTQILRHDFAIPIEVAAVDPNEYTKFVAPSERALVAGLTGNEVLLSETAARLRGAGTGLRMTTSTGRKLHVRGVLSDHSAAGYEVIAASRQAGYRDRFVLMQLANASARRSIEANIRSLLPRDSAVRIRAEGETPFLRYGDAVLPQALIKNTFGEFSARRLSSGYIEIDRSWIKDNIVTTRVALVGKVTCHRILIPQLKAAMQQVVASGLEFLVNPEQFGGCFSPRFVDRRPDGRLSHHAWGIAVDINVAENAFGTEPDQDRRLVEIFERLGFTWGGRWLVPDGMHFEWVRFPTSSV
jgi:hypothetical protein